MVILVRGPCLQRAHQILEYAIDVPDGKIKNLAQQLATTRVQDVVWLQSVDSLRRYLVREGLTIESGLWMQPLVARQGELVRVKTPRKGLSGLGGDTGWQGWLGVLLGAAVLGGLFWYIHKQSSKSSPRRSRSYERFPGLLESR